MTILLLLTLCQGVLQLPNAVYVHQPVALKMDSTYNLLSIQSNNFIPIYDLYQLSQKYFNKWMIAITQRTIILIAVELVELLLSCF